MSVRHIRLHTAACCLLALLPACLYAQAQELRYKFETGAKTAYIMEQKQNMKMSAQGNEFEINVNMTFDMTQTVESVDTGSGDAIVKQKIDRVIMKMEGGPIGSMEYDTKSEGEPEGPLSAMSGVFKAITQADIKMTLTPRGEVKDVKIPENLLNELKNAGGAQALGGNMFSEDQFKNMMNQSVLSLPEGAPRAGSTTWDKKFDMKMGPLGTMKSVTKYTYAGKSGNYDKIDMKVDMNLEADPNAPIQITMNTKEASGVTLFDAEKGRIHEINMKTVSEMDMGGIGNANIVQTMTLKLK